MPRKTKKRTVKKKTKFKIPPGLIVGGIFFLVILLIVFSIISLKVNNLKSEVTKQAKLTQKYQNEISSIESSIKLILFDYELDKEHFKKYYTDNLITFELSIPEDKIYNVRKSLDSIIEKKQFQLLNNMTYAKNGTPLFKVKINPYKEKLSNYEIDKHKINNLKNTKKKIALILDDAGNNLALAQKIVQLPYKITLSVIPFTQYDKETADLVRKHKKELFLHLPMQPKSYPQTDPGKGAILLNTPSSLIDIIIKKDVERIGKIDGANNHMGSALTENREKMKQVLKYLKKYTYTFVDSHTSKYTVAYDVCKNYMKRCGINNIFIDNLDNEEYIKNKINKGISLLEKNKKVIMIGHLRPNTVKVLENYLPELEKMGITFSTVNEVVAN